MNWLRRGSNEPLWKEEFSVRTADERYVTRRQLTKFLVLTSLGMFAGNIWILVRSIFYKAPIYPQQSVAQLGEIPVGGVKLFSYPTKEDHCIMIRTGENEYVSYSQKCTHLSCAVYYSQAENRLECPCDNAFYLDSNQLLATGFENNARQRANRMRTSSDLPPQNRGLTAIAGAMSLIAILLIVQIWLLSATLESFLGGNHHHTALPAAIFSGVIFLICLGLYAFVDRVDSAVRGSGNGV
jgi:hypothetical protein